MSASAQPGPIVIFGSRGQANPQIGPSAILGGVGLLDPRVSYNQNRTGWIGVGSGYVRCLSAVPATKAAANLAALANAVSGTPMTLVSSTGAGVTVLSTALQVWASGNTIPVGALAMDGLTGLINYGSPANPSGNYANNLYDSSKALARGLSITGVSGGAGGAFLVSGYDIYGYPMTETITAASGVATTNGLKAWKFVTSVVPQFSDAHNYSVGTADIFGFPLRAALFEETLIWWNSALITASTGFVAADGTSPATSSTGDVRGTYAVQSASDGSKRLTVAVGVGQLAPATAAGMFGVTQA